MKKVGLLVVIVTFGYAQAPDTLWTKTYGGIGDDVGYAVLQTDDGGFIIAGSTTSFGAGGTDAYVIKTDSGGNPIWTQCYGGLEDEELYDIKATLDGHYILAGYTKSIGNGGADIWLLEVDSLGDTLRTATYGGTGDDIAYSVEPAIDSGYVVTGYVPIGLYNAVYLLETHMEYNPDWMQIYELSGALNSRGNEVLRTSDGGYIVTADIFNPPLWYGWGVIIKTDVAGDTIWTASPTITLHDGHILQVAGGYTLGGTTGPDGLQPEIRLVRFNTDGGVLWDKILYDFHDHNPYFSEFASTCDGGYVVVGNLLYQGSWDRGIILIKADTNGDTLWHTFFGGANDDICYSVQQTLDNGYIIAGSTESFGAGCSDVYLIRTEPDVGVEEKPIVEHVDTYEKLRTTIFSGPLQLPEGKKCKVFDITGRLVEPERIQPGIYFIEVDGVVTQKVVKIR